MNSVATKAHLSLYAESLQADITACEVGSPHEVCALMQCSTPIDTSAWNYSCMTFAVLGSLGVLAASDLKSPPDNVACVVAAVRATALVMQLRRMQSWQAPDTCNDDGACAWGEQFGDSTRASQVETLKNRSGAIGFSDAMLYNYACMFDIAIVRIHQDAQTRRQHLELFNPQHAYGSRISIEQLVQMRTNESSTPFVVVHFSAPTPTLASQPVGHYSACPPLCAHSKVRDAMMENLWNLIRHEKIVYNNISWQDVQDDNVDPYRCVRTNACKTMMKATHNNRRVEEFIRNGACVTSAEVRADSQNSHNSHIMLGHENNAIELD